MKIAENKVVAIPISKVVAKPWIGPLPKNNKIRAVSAVVMLESKIDDKACLKPSTTAWLIFLPLRNSSLDRSNISTFESTAIPMVSTIPAIPGKVSTAPILANTPNMRRILNMRARSA